MAELFKQSRFRDTELVAAAKRVYYDAVWQQDSRLRVIE
jgi:hypothetical protein